MRNAVPPAPPAAAMAAAAAPVAKKFPEPLPAVPPLSSIARLQGKVRPMPMAMLLAAVMTLGSGGYLYFQARILMKKARLANTSQHHGAHSTVQPVSLQTPAPIVDQVHSAAMAPERPVIMETPILAPTAPAPSRGRGMVVSALINHVKLHSGPGLQFPVTGYIDADTHYHVIDWRDRWFRIALRGSEGGTAWVRNDVVKLIR